MFGYVKIRRGELRVREYEYYRASYCGLCRSMGKCTGQCSRFALSYDFAFLANVRMALAGTVPQFRRRRCVAHPLHKRTMLEPNDELMYCADAAAVLAFEKCRDDVSDERGWRRFRARMRLLFFRGAYRRARKRVPELAAIVREKLAELRELEREKRPSADAPAAIFGDLLAAIVAFRQTGEKARLAEAIGRQTGRFIYLVDAIDDLDEDAKRQRYNPLLLLFGKKPDDEERAGLRDALLATLSDLETAIDLLEDPACAERREVLRNILYLGMPATVQRVLYGEACKKEDSRE